MPTTRSTLLALLVSCVARTAAAQPTEPPPDSSPEGPTEPPVEAAPRPPAVAVPPPAAPAPTADDFDLATLGLDPHAAFDDKLNLYGFADFTYTMIDFRKESAFLTDTRTFGVGNLNLYVSKNLTPKWRTLAEIRFLFSPNASTNPDGTVTNTTALDPANQSRTIEWGGIRIERVYLEYDLHPKLTIRAGHFLSPYGIWNIDHGSPAIIPVQRPYVIGEQFIPEHQTGIEVFGSTHVGTTDVSYHATVSNGRHPAEATQDPDMKLAFGGRLALTTPMFGGTLSVGVSGYMGRMTALATSVLGPPPASADEIAYAADVVWKHGGLLVQGELMGRDLEYLVGRRPLIGAGFAPNGRDLGAYVLTGYRFDRAWNVMPFAMAEYYRPTQRLLFAEMRAGSIGLNFRPAPTIVLKAMATVGETEGSGQYGEIDRLYYYTGQAAWVF